MVEGGTLAEPRESAVDALSASSDFIHKTITDGGNV